MLLVIKIAMEKAQTEYKHDFNAHVSRNIAPIRTDDYLFLHKTCHNPGKEKRHNLSTSADGPYREVSMDIFGSTVFI